MDSRRLQAAFFGLRRPDGLPAASAGSIRAASESQFEGQTAATNEPVSGPLLGALSCKNTHSISRSPSWWTAPRFTIFPTMPTGKHQTKSPAPLRRSQRNAARATLSQAESPASIDAHIASIGRKAGNPPKAAISPDLDGPPSRKAVPGRAPRPPGRELIEIADRQVVHGPPAPPGDCEPHPVAHDPPAPPKGDQPAARRKAAKHGRHSRPP